MKLPFSIDQFLEIFKKYNLAVWPLQIVFYLLAIIMIFLALKTFRLSGKIIATVLAFFWLWMGIAYHLAFFTSINKAAYLFGTLFIIQGVFFLVIGLYKTDLSFQLKGDLRGIVGALLVAFSLIIYPIIGYFQGHIYPSSPTFGLPCPTTIFTFGIFLWSTKKISLLLMIIPLFWSIIGFSAAFRLGIREDSGLLISGLLSCALLLPRRNTNT